MARNLRLTEEQYQGLAKRKPVAKYRNVKTVVDGITFDSKKEARHYQDLQILYGDEVIPHPVFELWAYDKKNDEAVVVAKYEADFKYPDGKGGWVIEDVKSKATRTPLYRLKKKMMKACYGIDILET